MMSYKQKAIIFNFGHLFTLLILGFFTSKVNFFVGMAIGWASFIIHWKSYEYAKKYWLWKNGEKKIR